MREIRMLRSTRRGLETWHGRDGVTLADERASQQGTQTSASTGASVPDPTDPPPLNWSTLKYVFGRRRRTTMLKKRHKPEEMVAKLRQVDVLTSQGKSVADAIRTIGVTEVT